MLEYARESQHPGCKLDVDVREVGTEKEGPVGIGDVDDFADLFFELFGVLDLLGEVLGLEELVEGGYDVAVYLEGVKPWYAT